MEIKDYTEIEGMTDKEEAFVKRMMPVYIKDMDPNREYSMAEYEEIDRILSETPCEVKRLERSFTSIKDIVSYLIREYRRMEGEVAGEPQPSADELRMMEEDPETYMATRFGI